MLYSPAFTLNLWNIGLHFYQWWLPLLHVKDSTGQEEILEWSLFQINIVVLTELFLLFYMVER